MARLLDEGGADILLVGDSLGMVQSLPNTLPVTVDEICYHDRAVARGRVCGTADGAPRTPPGRSRPHPDLRRE